MMLRYITITSVLISLLTGSLCTALTALYHQNKADLIIITCSSFLYALATLFTILNSTFRSLWTIRALNIVAQLLIIACTINFFNNTVKFHNPITDNIHKHLIVAFESSLILNLFINGSYIGYSNSLVDNDQIKNVDEESENFIEEDKYIPLKNSSQTLTPDMENLMYETGKINNIDWFLQEFPRDKSNDATSTASVIKHQLGPVVPSTSEVNSFSKSQDNIKSRLRSLSQTSKKYNLKFMFRNGKKPTTGNDNTVKMETPQQKDINLNTKYVTRLSTISDLPKSFLNMIMNPSNSELNHITPQTQDRPDSMILDTPNQRATDVLQEEDVFPFSPALQSEKNAIVRINNALLPPCLHSSENISIPANLTNQMKSNSPLVVDIETNSNGTLGSDTSILEDRNLKNIPETQRINFNNTISNELLSHIEVPPNVTLDMWEKNKTALLERAAELQNNVLLPAFHLDMNHEISQPFDLVPPTPELQSKSSFSFPPDKQLNLKPHVLSPILTDDQHDAISALDEYLNDASLFEENEIQLLEESLAYEEISPSNAKPSSNDGFSNQARHSPTKSLISIMSGGGASVTKKKSLSGLSSFKIQSSSHHRSNSQLNFKFPIGPSANNSSSPTKSHRLRRIGKKLSLSNISDQFTPFLSEIGTHSSSNHNRGKSVDFSYLHSLQCHSPSKSVSGISITSTIPQEKRHSITGDYVSRRASGMFYKQHHNVTFTYNPEEIIEPPTASLTNDDSGTRQISQPTSCQTMESENVYPEVVTSQYDREKWNTMINLNIIDSTGKIKA